MVRCVNKLFSYVHYKMEMFVKLNVPKICYLFTSRNME